MEILKNLIYKFNQKFLRIVKLYKYYLSYKFWKNFKEINRQRTLIKDLKNAYKLLIYVDKRLQIYGWNRQRRRQFWRDFYSNAELRKEVFEDLLKEINNIRRG